MFTIGVRPQGDLIASGSFDCTIKLWDWQTGECVRTLVGHTAEVSSISFSPDGQLLASGSNDLTIRIWDVASGECLQVLQGHQDQVWRIVFTSSPERDGTQQLILVSIGFDRTVRFWHICTLSTTPPLPVDRPLQPRTHNLDSYCLKTIQGGTTSIRTLDCHPQGGAIASAGVDNQIWLWNEAGKCLKVLAARSGIWKVTFHPHERMLASAGFDGEIKLWDIDTGCCLRSLSSSWVQTLRFSPQGELISSSSSDAKILFWNVQTGECVRTIDLAADAFLLDLAFHPQGHYTLTGNRLYFTKRLET